MEFDSLLVFAFGNRITPDGELLPGLVNEELARITEGLAQEHQVPVFAQWEIADLLVAAGVQNVISVTPDYAPDGTVIYLSTDGVARKALVLSEEVGIRLGRAAVLGHRDHVERCRRTAIKAGIEIVAIPNELMPSMYDAESGQEWTRSRDVYLKADAYAMRLLNES